MKNILYKPVMALRNPVRCNFLVSTRLRQFQPYESLREAQAIDIQHVLSFAKSNIPYYRDMASADITDFPILTKDIIRTHPTELACLNDNYYKNTSGGSTGEPVVFLQDRQYKERNEALKLLFFEWGGYSIGDFYLKLWGSERDIRRRSVTEFFKNRLVLNSFKMSTDDMYRYVDIINTKKPKLIEAYAQSIYLLAKFIQKENLALTYVPECILTSAGMLYPEMRKEIETVFGTAVLNRYGSREVGDIACSCPDSTSLHADMFNHYVEILDESGKPCDPGVVGYVHVTTLHNYVMPLIRYRIGDMAAWDTCSTCTCGRGLPLLKKVVGREVNMFKNNQGDMIDGEYFTHLFYFHTWVKQFQIVQHSLSNITVTVALTEGVHHIPTDDANSIESDMRKVLGDSVAITWDLVEEILPLKSGKYLYTISHVN